MVISSLYTSSGTKLRQQTKIGSDITEMTDYCGNIIYNSLSRTSVGNSSLAFILMPEGRIICHSEQSEDLRSKHEVILRFNYFLTDHLGNTRTIVSDSGKVLEENSYYAFGMQINELSFSNSAPENRYLYNGKELQTDFGLDWHDYGARMYDAQIGRWHVVDPLAESYYSWSPYNYVANSPMIFIDPNGMKIDDPPWFKLKAEGAITANSISANAVVWGSKTGFAVNVKKQDVVRFSAGYNTNDNLFAKEISDYTLKTGAAYGDVFGVSYNTITDLDENYLGGETSIHAVAFALNITNTVNDDGQIVKNKSISVAFGGELSIFMGIEGEISATVNIASDVIDNGLTIDGMLKKNYTVSPNEIDWNNQRKENLKELTKFLLNE